MTIVEFLTERIAEDEAVAYEQHKAEQFVYGTGQMYAISHAAVGLAPHRAIAECAAKRAVLDQREQVRLDLGESSVDQRRQGNIPILVNVGLALDVTIKHLAAVYQDHHDYDEEWSL
jgi:hypothetical protein